MTPRTDWIAPVKEKPYQRYVLVHTNVHKFPMEDEDALDHEAWALAAV